MFRKTRLLHRWIGAILALFFACISVTGFLLALKGELPWMRPPIAEAVPLAKTEDIISIDAAMRAAFAVGRPELQTVKHVDRVDYRPKGNVFKVISKDGYREIQIDGHTGGVVSDSFRSDQLAEDIHDLSFFADFGRTYVLPFVATGLFLLAVSGLWIFFTPYVLRWKFKKNQKEAGALHR